MTTAAHYARAAIPEPYTILGLRLKPLSLQHYLLMARFDCAFVAESEVDATIGDLILGVLICSKDWEDGEFEEYISRLTPVVWWNPKTWLKRKPQYIADAHAWGQKVGVHNLKKKAQLFADYIAENSKVPSYWEEQAGKASGGHWTQSVLLTMTGNLGYSRREAIRAPLVQVLSDYFKHAESCGAIRLIDESELSPADTNAAAIEAALKGVVCGRV